MSSLSIEFAGARYRFAGLTPNQTDRVRSRFGALLCTDDARPQVSTDVHFNPNRAAFMPPPAGPVEYEIAIAHDAQRIAVAGIGFTANIDRAPFRAQMQTCLEDDWFLGAFENLFRALAAYQVFGDGGLIMHSAAFTEGSRGFLFCGRSGAGKTTLCRLADELELNILSDELNAVTPADGSFELLAMPFAGDFGGIPKPHPPYPLTGLLGLQQSDSPALYPCSKAEAVSRIVASCPYVNSDPLLIDELASRVERLIEQVPLRILGFAKNTRFWSVLNHEYRSPQSTVPA